MNKSAIVAALQNELRTQYERAVAALAGAHEAATGTDTRAENKYDTRGLEASYLAAGQAGQAEELGRGLASLEHFDFRDFDPDEPISAGALVETEIDGELRHFLLAPAGGGVVVTAEDGGEVTVLGPAAPLAARLLGKTAGSILPDPEVMILDVF